MTISKQYIPDEQTYVVSISKPHINTIQNDYMRQYRNNIVPILACLLGRSVFFADFGMKVLFFGLYPKIRTFRDEDLFFQSSS